MGSGKNGGKKEQGKQQNMPQQQPPPMPPPAPGPPFMGRPPQMPYPPGGFPFPGAPPMGSPPDPNQQRMLQMQIRQQQIQLQQMQQQQQQQQAAQQASQQHRVSPSHTHPNPAQQQQQQNFSSFTTTTTPHSVKPPAPAPVPPKAKAPSPAPRKPANPPPTPEQVKLWMAQCDWRDKTIHVARQLLGGSSINGFLKATAAAQRIKKQRARQVSAVLKKRNAESAEPENPQTTPIADELKNDIMNARTAKKMRLEMQQGAQFVKNMYENVQSIMRDLDPGSIPPSIHRLTTPKVVKPKTTMPKKYTPIAAPPPKQQVKQQPTTVVETLPLGAHGSELRKNRKHKLANYTCDVGISVYDANGKRTFSRKEHNLRIAELLRFRALRPGDYVAARLSSRDLWILARVVRDYPPIPMMSPNEFLKLTTVSSLCVGGTTVGL